VRHKVYAFVMTLAWSRHQYVEFVTDQKVTTWLGLHVRAFAFFGGAPRRVTCDNLKAAIVRAAWNDPDVNRDYGECAEHYGFRIAPCRPYTPQHKGKVERGVGYVQGNFWAGRGLTDLEVANRAVRHWCLHEAGQRVHGTTRELPLKRFAQTEQKRLLPLPPVAFDMAVSKEVKLHRDCYVVFDGSYYSAPFRLVHQKLRVRAGVSTVRLYDTDHHLVATHERAQQPGERHTHPDHLPKEKLPGLYQTPEDCRDKAAGIGSATLELVEAWLADPVLDRLRTAGRLVRLVERYPSARVEAACARALRFGDPCYATVKRILQEGLDQEPEPTPAAPAPVSAFLFARNAEDLFGPLTGELSWN
jgi:hypothetical protein